MLGLPPAGVLARLRGLAARHLISLELAPEEGWAFQLLAPPPDPAGLAPDLAAWLERCVRASVHKLDDAYRALGSAADARSPAEQERRLRAAIQGYFEDAAPGQGPGGGMPGGGGTSDAGNDGDAQGTGGEAAAPDEDMDEGGDRGSQSAHSGTRAPGCGTQAPGCGTQVPGCGAKTSAAPLPLRGVDAGVRLAVAGVAQQLREEGHAAPHAQTVARILLGVGSPAFPADAYRKKMRALWGACSRVCAWELERAARELLQRTGSAQRAPAEP